MGHEVDLLEFVFRDNSQYFESDFCKHSRHSGISVCYAAIPLKIEVQPNESCRVAPGPNLQLVYRYESFEHSAGPDT